jgi:hypothetical protein
LRRAQTVVKNQNIGSNLVTKSTNFLGFPFTDVESTVGWGAFVERSLKLAPAVSTRALILLKLSSISHVSPGSSKATKIAFSRFISSVRM